MVNDKGVNIASEYNLRTEHLPKTVVQGPKTVFVSTRLQEEEDMWA